MDARDPTEWLGFLTVLALRPNERTKRLPQNQEYLEQGMGKETDENAEVERGGRRSSSLPASPLKDITDNVDEDEGDHNKRYSFRTRGARKSSIMESDEEEQEEDQQA